MRIIRNKYLPLPLFRMLNISGLVFVRTSTELTSTDYNHELIHTAQMKELLHVFYYIWYAVEWIVRKIVKKTGAVVFEREVTDNKNVEGYVYQRKHYAWLKAYKKAEA